MRCQCSFFYLERSFRGGGECFCWVRKCENHPAGRLNLLLFGGEISPPKVPEKKNSVNVPSPDFENGENLLYSIRFSHTMSMNYLAGCKSTPSDPRQSVSSVLSRWFMGTRLAPPMIRV